MALNYSKGTISFKSEVTSGTSNNGFGWARQNILIDIPGFQGNIKKISLQASNDMVEELNNFNVGDKVEVGWTIYAREWNGKWYNNVDLVDIKSLDQQNTEQKPAHAPTPKAKVNPANELEPQEGDLPW